MRPMLVCRTRGTFGTPAVFTLTMDTLTQLGNAPAIAAESTDVSGVSQWAGNRVIFYRGRLYWLIRDTIRRLNFTTGDWDVLYTIPSMSTSLNEKTGLYIFSRGGVSCLGFAYETTTAGQWFVVYTTNGDNWKRTDFGTSVTAFDDEGFKEIFFNNKIWTWGSAGGNVVDFDTLMPGDLENSLGTANATRNLSSPFIYHNIPMALTHVNGARIMIAIGAGACDTLLTINSDTTGFDNEVKGAVLVDEDFFYPIYWAASSWKMNQIKMRTDHGDFPTTLVNNDISSTVLPVTFATRASFRIVYDNNVAPGQRPNIYIAAVNSLNDGTVIDWYRWMGPNQAWEGIGSIGDCYMALPTNCQYGGGEYFYEPNRIDVQLEKYSRGTTTKTTKLFYRLTESSTIPSGSLARVGFLGQRMNNYENLPASGFISGLQNTSVGTISSDGKFINNVPIGSGTLHTVEWDGTTDRVFNRTGAVLIPYASGL